MKRLLVAGIALLMAVSLISCGKDSESFDDFLETAAEGSAFSKITVDGEDVLLLSNDSFEFDGVVQAVSADIYVIKDGAVENIGSAASGGSANPLQLADGKIYAASHHSIDRIGIKDKALVKETARDDESEDLYNEMFDEYASGDIIEFEIK